MNSAGVKRKSKDKRWFQQQARKKPRQSGRALTAGVDNDKQRGFLLFCNKHEREALEDGLRLLSEYADLDGDCGGGCTEAADATSNGRDAGVDDDGGGGRAGGGGGGTDAADVTSNGGDADVTSTGDADVTSNGGDAARAEAAGASRAADDDGKVRSTSVEHLSSVPGVAAAAAARRPSEVSPSPACESASSSSDDDIDAALEKEHAALKSQRPPQPRGAAKAGGGAAAATDRRQPRFQPLATGVTNVLFIRSDNSSVPDPVRLTLRLLRDLSATGVQRSRFLLRLLPVQVVCKAYAADVARAAKVLANKYFGVTPPHTPTTTATTSRCVSAGDSAADGGEIRINDESVGVSASSVAASAGQAATIGVSAPSG